MIFGNLWSGLRNRELRYTSLLFQRVPQDGLLPFNSFSFRALHVWDSAPNRFDDGSISCLVCVCVERLNRRKTSFFSFLDVFLRISNYIAGGQ